MRTKVEEYPNLNAKNQRRMKSQQLDLKPNSLFTTATQDG
jgi:hypothetical protein